MSFASAMKAHGRPTSSPPIPDPSALTILLSTRSSSTHPPPPTALPLEILHNLRHQHFWTDIHLHHSVPASSKAPQHPAFTTKDTLNPSISDLDLTTAPQSSPSARRSYQQPAADLDPLPYEPLRSHPTTLLSGVPPKSLYIHPNLQRKLLKANIPESTLSPEREWVLPTSLGAKWTLSQICAVFDSLPPREPRRVHKDGGDAAGGSTDDTQNDKDATSRWDGSDSTTGGEKGNKNTRRSKGGEERPVVTHQDAKRVLLAMKAHEGMGGDGTVVYYIVQEGEVKPRQN